jgi:hypothetical protein
MADNGGLEIVVGDNYRESFPDIMGVLPSEAFKVMREPDAHGTIDVGEGGALKINVSLRLPSETRSYYLLVLDREDEHGVRVLHDAFKFYDDLCRDVKEKTPLELLASVADRFAYLVRPGGEAKKLILQERFPCAPEDVNTEAIIRMMMPLNVNKGEEVLATQYVMYNEGAQAIEFAVAFVWNVTRYREYLARAN